jgi:hemoglobin-like flavoprotein
MPTPIKSITADQRRLVRDSFDLLRDMTGPVALLFYGKLFELDPSARRLFHIDLDLQGQKVMNMLSSIVESLDDFESIQAKLAELGRQHASYGVRPEQYEILTTALLWTLTQTLGSDFDARSSQAWKLALAAVNEAMKAGANEPSL